MKMGTPRQDPQLRQEQERAQAERVRTVQDQLGSETDRLFRMFGARGALSGTSVKAPSLMGR